VLSKLLVRIRASSLKNCLDLIRFGARKRFHPKCQSSLLALVCSAIDENCTQLGFAQKDYLNLCHHKFL
jgi:hypothetical protein